MKTLLALIFTLCALPALAAQSFTFANIDGGTIALDQWKGRPVLVVNTASRCGFTPQYNGLQDLYDRYKTRGLVVLAVPSDDFKQELATGAQVKEFCAVNFDLTLPMTDITHVKGPQAHAFYQWLKESQGWEPGWNFNKVLLDRDGKVAATWGSTARPLSRAITDAIDKTLQ
ncbi:glutathione peroxidase [Tropicibacter sp. S64]|uniref:glutathione peroxidase n=1 Tax=Tropicibacter sp. S64 TaxID=3415122 RepID=UPI003C7BA9CD